MSSTKYPLIQKTSIIKGKTLIFRNANENDAEFILSLRTDERKSRYLSVTSNDIAAQRIWLEKYKNSTSEAYFIIEYDSDPIGTVRLYDPQQDSFCWGSWILKDSRPHQAAMESALIVYTYAIEILGFRASHFDVRKENERVWQFHERFGAVRTSETEIDYLYKLPIESIQESLQRYKKFLPLGISICAS